MQARFKALQDATKEFSHAALTEASQMAGQAARLAKPKLPRLGSRREDAQVRLRRQAVSGPQQAAVDGRCNQIHDLKVARAAARAERPDPGRQLFFTFHQNASGNIHALTLIVRIQFAAGKCRSASGACSRGLRRAI